MVRKTATLASILILTISAAGPAQTNEEDATLTLSEVVRLALENNPDLLVLAHKLEGVRTKIRQADEFPATSIDFDFDQQITFLRSDEIYFGFSQEIEFPTRIGLRRDLARNEIKTAETQHEQSKWELTAEVKALYQRLSLSHELVSLAEENLVIAKRLQQMAEQKYRLGSVGKLDLLRAGIEAAVAANELERLQESEKELRTAINYLIGRPAEQPLLTSPFKQEEELALDVDELINIALQRRKELSVVRSRQAEAAINLSLVRSEFYPDFSIGFSRHKIAGEPDSWDITAGISIPIFGRGAIAGRVAEAEAEERALRAEARAVAARIELEVRTAFRESSQLDERVKRYRNEILAIAEEAFRLARASYSEGEIESLELLLESQRTLQDVRQTYAETVFAYNLSLINLERAVGTGIGSQTTTN